MFKFNGIFIAFLMLFSGVAYADVVSLSANYVPGEADVVTHLNNDRTSLANGVNSVRGVFSGSVQSSGQIKAGTVGEENMADDASARLRTHEGAWCNDFTYTGLLPSTTTGTLVGSVPAGIGYPLGYRVVKSGGTAHTFTASKWTWVDMDIAGSFTYVEQPIGSVAPSVTANSMRLARVSTDSTQIFAVQDLRVTNCSTGPFSNFADASGESTLSDLLVYGAGGFENGLNLVSYDNNNVTVNPGSAYINGEYRTLIAAKQVPINSAGNSLTGIDGLDSGSVAANTTYYAYATADINSTKPPIVLWSANASAPAGSTNYRKIGEATTDASKFFASGDVTSVTYLGKIRQVKRFSTGATASGTTLMPWDNSVPTSSEGDQYMTMNFTPINANNKLRVEAQGLFVNSSGDNISMALYDGGSSAISSSYSIGTLNASQQINISHVMTAGSTAVKTFSVRAGNQASGTLYFNGNSSGRLMGDVANSYIQVTEYEG